MNYFHVLYLINFPSFYSAFSVLYFLLLYIFIISFSISVLFSQKTHTCKSCRSLQELSNEYLLAKFGVDTAENGPLKHCQKLEKKFRKNIGLPGSAMEAAAQSLLAAQPRMPCDPGQSPRSGRELPCGTCSALRERRKRERGPERARARRGAPL